MLNVGQLEELCKATGFNFNEHGVLFDTDLRPYMPQPLQRWDAMHCFLSHGTAATEMVVFLDASKRKLIITYADLEVFCNAAWMCQPNRKPDFKVVFSSKREKYSSQDSSWKGTAADLLGIFPLVHEFAERVMRPTSLMNDEIASFTAMANVVRIYKRLKRSRTITAEQCDLFQNALQSHGVLHKLAYGDEFIKPKFHYSQHIPLQLRTLKLLVDAFTVERKHKSAKAIANQQI